MDDLAMTCSDFVNALKMLICSEKHPVFRANYGYTKEVVINKKIISAQLRKNAVFRVKTEVTEDLVKVR